MHERYPGLNLFNSRHTAQLDRRCARITPPTRQLTTSFYQCSFTIWMTHSSFFVFLREGRLYYLRIRVINFWNMRWYFVAAFLEISFVPVGSISLRTVGRTGLAELSARTSSRRADRSREKRCPAGLDGVVSCSGRGACAGSGVCVCECGWGGDACGEQLVGATLCPNACSGSGECILGKCFCYPGSGGKDCSSTIGCTADTASAMHRSCSSRGTCRWGRCFCAPGWSGVQCEDNTRETPSFSFRRVISSRAASAPRSIAASDANSGGRGRSGVDDGDVVATIARGRRLAGELNAARGAAAKAARAQRAAERDAQQCAVRLLRNEAQRARRQLGPHVGSPTPLAAAAASSSTAKSGAASAAASVGVIVVVGIAFVGGIAIGLRFGRRQGERRRRAARASDAAAARSAAASTTRGGAASSAASARYTPPSTPPRALSGIVTDDDTIEL